MGFLQSRIKNQYYNFLNFKLKQLTQWQFSLNQMEVETSNEK
jgi:hypothetical protein